MRKLPNLEVGSLNDHTLAASLCVVSRYPPFNDFSFGLMVHNITNQLRYNANILAIVDGRLVGYAGWLRVKNEHAKAWVKGEQEIPQEDWANGDAIVVTILVSDSRSYVLPLVRAISHVCAGVPAYRRRSFQDGRADIIRPPLMARPHDFGK